jgi:hypothetical protein
MQNELDISDYYRIITIKEMYIHDEIRGFWSDQVVDQVGPEFLRIWKAATESFDGRGFITLTDWSTCPVLTEEAKKYLVEAMVILKECNGLKVVEVVPRHTTRWGIKTAAAKTGKDDFRVVVDSLAEGFKVVEELQRTLIKAT